jgi:hydrogenase maturation protease
LTRRVLVAGIGSEYRGDDGVGIAVVRRVEHLQSGAESQTGAAATIAPLSDPLDLLGRWDGTDLAIVVDATRSGEPAGTVRTRELETFDPPSGESSSARLNGRASTHGLGLDDVLRLARSLGSAPGRVVLVGVEGSAFGLGEDLSPAVAAAVQEAAQAVLDMINEADQCA